MLLPALSIYHELFVTSVSALVSRLFITRLETPLPTDPNARLLPLQAVHFVFNQYEPQRARTHALLLILVPAILSCLPSGLSVLVSLAVTFATYWGTLAFSIGFYRISPWHPLSRHPGPFLLRLSKLPMAWLSRSGKRHLYTQELHRRYGDVVRVGTFPRYSLLRHSATRQYWR